MKLICPGCGSVASAEAWLNDALCRETMAAIVQLPGPLSAATIGYLSLFRPGKRSLTWKKCRRLVCEIAAIAADGHVQVQGRVSRPCPARIWAAAMDQMLEQRDRLRLPMPSHNYLRQVAWDLADRDDSGREQVVRQNEAAGRRQAPRGVDPLERARQEWDKKNGGADQSLLPEFIVRGMD